MFKKSREISGDRDRPHQEPQLAPILLLPQPFWEKFFELLPKSNFYKTCKKAIKIQQTHNDTFFDNGNSIYFDLGFLVKYYPNLQTLVLRDFNLLQDTDLNDEDTKYLTRLKSLDLINSGVFGSAEIFRRPWSHHLTRLNLSNSSWHYDYIEDDYDNGRKPKCYNLYGISNCTKLIELGLGGFVCINDEDLQEICQITSLKRLDMSQYLEYDSAPPGYQERYFFHAETIQELTKLMDLEDLSLNCCTQIRETGFNWLSKLTNLKTLNLARTRIEHRFGGLEALRRLPNLRNLAIGENMSQSIHETHFHDFINFIGSLTQIQHLCLPGLYCYTGDYMFPSWSAFKSLKSICIAGGEDEMEGEIENIIKDTNIVKIYVQNPFVDIHQYEYDRQIEVCGKCTAQCFFITT